MIWIECANCGGRHRNADRPSCEASIRHLAKRRGYHVTKRYNGQYRLVDDRDMIILGEEYDATLKEIADYLRDPGLDQWFATHR